MRVTVAQAAAQDRADVLAFLNAPSAAGDLFLDAVRSGLNHLQLYPRSASRRDDLTSHDVCFWLVGSYFLVLSVQETEIQLVAILHTSRNVRRELSKRLGVHQRKAQDE